MNQKTRESPENTKKRKIAHILENASIQETDYDFKKGFEPQNRNTSNTSTVGLNKKMNTNVLIMYLGNKAVQRASPYACSGEIYRK